jgi:hypothetical protein
MNETNYTNPIKNLDISQATTAFQLPKNHNNPNKITNLQQNHKQKVQKFKT